MGAPRNSQDSRWDRRDSKIAKRRNDMARDGARRQAILNSFAKRARKLGIVVELPNNGGEV